MTFHHREHARGITLIVSGHDDLRSYSFHDLPALLNFEHEMEEFLLQTGWSPVEFTIEPPLPTSLLRSPDGYAPRKTTRG